MEVEFKLKINGKELHKIIAYFLLGSLRGVDDPLLAPFKYTFSSRFRYWVLGRGAPGVLRQTPKLSVQKLYLSVKLLRDADETQRRVLRHYFAHVYYALGAFREVVVEDSDEDLEISFLFELLYAYREYLVDENLEELVEKIIDIAREYPEFVSYTWFSPDLPIEESRRGISFEEFAGLLRGLTTHGKPDE